MNLIIRVLSAISITRATTELESGVTANAWKTSYTFDSASALSQILAGATFKSLRRHGDDNHHRAPNDDPPLILPPSQTAQAPLQVTVPPPPLGGNDTANHGSDSPSAGVGVQSGAIKKPRTNYDSWQHIRHASRDHRDPYATSGWDPKAMASSALFYQWFALFAVLPLLVLLHHHLVKWSMRTGRHFSAILGIVGVASVFMAGIRLTVDPGMAVMWATGFVLEILFSLENIFAFYVVIAAFKAPRRLAHKAIFTVVCFQIAFQMIFFMGLASLLRSFKLLPYVLGVWLMYGGVQCALDDDGEDIDIQNTPLYKGFVWFLGKRVHPEFDRHMIVVKDGKFCITLLGLLTLSLMVTDFLLEIDVTLTKIEEMDNQWVAFSSSAFAAFTVPQFIFIAQELFRKYSLLKYAVSFTLVFFGAEMMAADIVHIPDIMGCSAVLVVVMISIAASPPPPPEACDLTPRSE